MRRQRYDAFARADTPRYIVLWDMFYAVLEQQMLPPRSDLVAAMTAATDRLRREGWTIESDFDYGSVFISRGGERRLLALTARDPADTTHYAFNPFR